MKGGKGREEISGWKTGRVISKKDGGKDGRVWKESWPSSVDKEERWEKKKSRGGQIKYYTNRLSTKYERDALFFSIIRWSGLFHRSDLFDRLPALIFPSLRPVPSTRFISSYTFSIFFLSSFSSFSWWFFFLLLFLWYLSTFEFFFYLIFFLFNYEPM